MWHFFEQQIHYPLTVLGTDYLASVPLSKFDVLILPDGSYEDVYSERQLEALKTWVRGGGKVIALEGAARFLAGKKDFLLKQKAPDTTATAKKPDPYRLLQRYGDAERRQIGERVQGSVYRVQLDNTHPLAFGYGPSYFALVRDPLNYRFLGEGGWERGRHQEEQLRRRLRRPASPPQARRHVRARRPGYGPRRSGVPG